MRATWPGARSGRIAITTRPLAVSRIIVSSGLAIKLRLSLVPCILDMQYERPSRNRVGEAFGQRQWGAAAQWRQQRAVIDRTPLFGDAGGLVGDAGDENLAVPLERKPHRQLHAGAGLALRRPLPAPAQRFPDVGYGVE